MPLLPHWRLFLFIDPFSSEIKKDEGFKNIMIGSDILKQVTADLFVDMLKKMKKMNIVIEQAFTSVAHAK